MADVFISYKREEIAWAGRVAQALSEEGFSAFYDLDDNGIHAGEEWDKRLEQELAVAKCCVVLWSGASTESPNVRSEARRANSRGILVPARISVCQAPLGLDALQEADLCQWRGDRSDPQWRFLVDRGVARKLGRPGRPPHLAATPTPPPPPAKPLLTAEIVPPTPKLQRWVTAAGAAGLALAAVFVWAPWTRSSSSLGNDSEPPPAQSDQVIDKPIGTRADFPPAAAPVAEAPPPKPEPTVRDLIGNWRDTTGGCGELRIREGERAGRLIVSQGGTRLTSHNHDAGGVLDYMGDGRFRSSELLYDFEMHLVEDRITIRYFDDKMGPLYGAGEVKGCVWRRR
jgi:hypothetical protein